MNTLPISAQAKRRGLKTSSLPARAVPTSTGATAAGRVRGRAATSQRRSGLKSRALRELAEVRPALLAVGVAALLRLLAAVEEQVRVVGQLLDPGQPVLGGIEAR